MVTYSLRFVVKDTDRHGNVRFYFRRGKQPKVRLRGEFGSAEFMSAYQAALNSVHKPKKGIASPQKGSFGYVCNKYFHGNEFSQLDHSTQGWRRRHLNKLCERCGHIPIRDFKAVHIKKFRNELRDTPGAARTRLKAMKALFSWAVEYDYVDDNPAKDIQFLKYHTEGYHTWTAEELVQFERTHPAGTQAYLAMHLLLFTACRREDVVRLGPQHIREGRISYRQAKNEHRNPVDCDIPVHPKLREAIASAPSGHLTFLATEHGKPFSANGFGNKFRVWCDEAGLGHCTAHGLRKAAASLLAEKGCTPHEIAAVTGHTSLAEVERYTKKAEKKKLSDSAMSKLK